MFERANFSFSSTKKEYNVYSNNYKFSALKRYNSCIFWAVLTTVHSTYRGIANDRFILSVMNRRSLSRERLALYYFVVILDTLHL